MDDDAFAVVDVEVNDVNVPVEAVDEADDEDVIRVLDDIFAIPLGMGKSMISFMFY